MDPRGRRRFAVQTNPPTFTAGEVCSVLKEGLTEVDLHRLDLAGLFRPSYYCETGARGRLITREQRDELLKGRGASRGDPRRRYSYQDLVWLRLIGYVRDRLKAVGVKRSSRTAAQVVQALRSVTNDVCPASARLVFVGREVYLAHDGGMAEPLTKGSQLAMTVLLLDSVVGDVRGRVAVLAAHEQLRVTTTIFEEQQYAASS